MSDVEYFFLQEMKTTNNFKLMQRLEEVCIQFFISFKTSAVHF
jgi:hypothetical protein